MYNSLYDDIKQDSNFLCSWHLVASLGVSWHGPKNPKALGLLWMGPGTSTEAIRMWQQGIVHELWIYITVVCGLLSGYVSLLWVPPSSTDRCPYIRLAREAARYSAGHQHWVVISEVGLLLEWSSWRFTIPIIHVLSNLYPTYTGLNRNFTVYPAQICSNILSGIVHIYPGLDDRNIWRTLLQFMANGCKTNRHFTWNNIHMVKTNSNHSCKSSTFLQSNHQLVGGFNHLEKYESQWKGWHPIYYGK